MSIMKIAGLVLKSSVSKPATRLYPFVKRQPYANTRGAIAIDIAACIFCGICQKKCPTEAITVTKSERTWAINRLRCIQCGACVEACPKKCLTMENQYSPAVFASGALDSFVQAAPAAAAPAAGAAGA